jgi:hypothetical protein
MPFSQRLISIRDPLGNVQSIGDILGNALSVVETLREIKKIVLEIRCEPTFLSGS